MHVYGVCSTSVIDTISVGYMAQRSNVRVNGQISERFTVLKDTSRMPTLSIPLQHTGQFVDAHDTGFTDDFRVSRRLINHERYNDIVLVASSKTALQEFIMMLHVTW